MKAVFAVVIPFLGLLLTGARAEATVVLLHSPSIDFKAGVDKGLADAIHAVVQDKRFQFLGGGHGRGWGPEHDYTNLIYRGDTKALDSFLTRLARVQGLHVRVRLSGDLSKRLGEGWWKDEFRNEALAPFGAKITPPVPGWEVVHSKKSPDRLEVWINLASPDLSVERLLEKWLVERAGKTKRVDD